MLFSEPKIPQLNPSAPAPAIAAAAVSVLFSEPKIPQSRRSVRQQRHPGSSFQCSSASRKFLNSVCLKLGIDKPLVSVLFSEPKIPQSKTSPSLRSLLPSFQCSSASRKFLNRSAFSRRQHLRHPVSVLFSEPKIPQSSASRPSSKSPTSFSALQRAENSSIVRVGVRVSGVPVFQCSSASRKFLNVVVVVAQMTRVRRFSALQRAENSSIQHRADCAGGAFKCFSALQRAENSSIRRRGRTTFGLGEFQCSSASRKFLNAAAYGSLSTSSPCFSALQRAENSSMHRRSAERRVGEGFQCSSASRKFLNIKEDEVL